MVKPPSKSSWLKRCLAGGVVSTALLAASPVLAQQILPADFFAQLPPEQGNDISVAADTMVFNSRNDTVLAVGNVGISYQGVRATADRAIYYQRTGRVELVGNVAFLDTDGVEYIAERVELEDGFKQAFLQSLLVALPDGTYLSASQTSIDQGVQQVFVDGTYSPCGTCIDEKGNRIGWTVKAARIISDDGEQIIYFEEPSLQLLGTTVIALPYLEVPRGGTLQLPVLSYDSQYGVGISLPFFRYPVADGTLALTPSVYTNQGVGLAVDWSQEIGDLAYSVNGSVVYQANPGAYTGLANRTVRGALQTEGTFTPTDAWTLGWSYTAFTDPGYLPDYRIASGTETNEIFAQYLADNGYADIRTQQFLPLGNQASWAAYDAEANQQALTHPNAEFDKVVDLDDDAGRITLAGKLLGLSRAADDTSTGFVQGYEGQSFHAMAQASWTNQYIVPGGLAVSPYLGARVDGASYDGASALGSAPAQQTLFSATPIAALDVRYPLMARTQGATHIIEPIAQLVYRGGPAVPGIVNNESQSLVLDSASLFDYDRFSGADRQETGLRSNVGMMLSTSFDNGGWLTASVGQSFHLAGPNGNTISDGSTAAIGSSLERDTSYLVGGIEAGFGSVSGGAQAQFDPLTGTIPQANGRVAVNLDGYTFAGTYAWAAAEPALGETEDRNDFGIDLGIPVADYWTVRAGTSYDLVANELIKTTASIEYDDDYLAYGLGARFNGPISNWGNDFAVALQFRLSAAQAQEIVGFDYDFD